MSEFCSPSPPCDPPYPHVEGFASVSVVFFKEHHHPLRRRAWSTVLVDGMLCLTKFGGGFRMLETRPSAQADVGRDPGVKPALTARFARA